MSHALSTAGYHPIARILPYLVGGLVAVSATDYLPPILRQIATWPALASPVGTVSNVARKGDRAAPARATTATPNIATVEVVGVRDRAIVYRDSDGRELFRTDPISNVTIVTKGLTLPEVTVRQHSGSAVKPVPLQPRETARDSKTPPRTPVHGVPDGCEPSFSPVASPALAHHIGRCIAAIEAPQRVAQLSH